MLHLFKVFRYTSVIIKTTFWLLTTQGPLGLPRQHKWQSRGVTRNFRSLDKIPFSLFFSPMRKRKHRSSKHHQSGKDTKRQKQEQQQSQYWTAEKKRTVGVVEPRVVVRIPKKHLNEPNSNPLWYVFVNFCLMIKKTSQKSFFPSGLFQCND